MNIIPPRTPKGIRWGGRQKGTPNKLTVGVKDAIRVAFIEAGGVDYLVNLAKSEPRIFCALLARLLTRKDQVVPSTNLGDFQKLSDKELDAKLERLLASLNALKPKT